jgi:hypothetical protein
MSEPFAIVVVTASIPHPIFFGIAALLVLRVIWWLPDWCLKVVLLVAVVRRLRRSASVDANDD